MQPFEEELEGVQALHWVVPVTAESREQFEAERQAERSGGYQITERDDLPKVNIDPTSFDQLLVNLCVNARDAIKDQGSIRISLQRRKYPVCTCRSCDTPISGQYVVSRLLTRAPGFRRLCRQAYSRLFLQPGNPARARVWCSPSSITSCMVCNGHIMLQSKPGRGTTFHVLFPCEENAAVPELRMVV